MRAPWGGGAAPRRTLAPQLHLLPGHVTSSHAVDYRTGITCELRCGRLVPTLSTGRPGRGHPPVLLPAAERSVVLAWS